MKEKPTPPGNYDCCESGCCPCVWDTYYDEMNQWREEQAAAKAAELATDATKITEATESTKPTEN